MIQLIKVNGAITNFDFEGKYPSLTEMQEAVGDNIQMVAMSKKGLCPKYLICNEEGKLNNLEINMTATSFWEEFYGETDIIVGDILIADIEDIE